MNPLNLSILAIALAASPALAQSGVTDAGTPNFNTPGFAGGPAFGAGCGTGVTPAHPFVAGNGFAGNMFDIAPSVDMTIECVDVNWSVVESIDVAVWWCPGTVVGNDMNQLGTWQQFDVTTVTSAGLNQPTNVPLDNSPTFLAGSTYGIYVQVVNYATTAGTLMYTNGGPFTYAGTHCSLTTYYGKGDGLTSSTFNPRAWNGNLYTDVTGPPAPALAKTGTCPGAMTLTATNCTAGGTVALLRGQAGSFTQTGNPCTGLTLGISNPILSAMLTANGSGSASISFNAPAAACGLTVQAVDVASCVATNTIVL